MGDDRNGPPGRVPFRGVAVRDAARTGSAGRVVSVHGKAVYLDLGGALIAIVSGSVEPGPLHLHSGPPPPAAVGQRITCDGSRIVAPTWAVRCDLPVWEGTLPDPWPELPDRSAEVPITIPADVPVASDRVRTAVRAGAIEELTRLLGGHGPGLTPAGDDLLAGLLLAARARWGPDVEPRLVAAVRRVRTTRPARAFLYWAARGQSLAPAHDVLTALAGGGHDERAAGRLTAIGASSGRCLLAGLRIGVAQLPRLAAQRTRAGSDNTL